MQRIAKYSEKRSLQRGIDWWKFVAEELSTTEGDALGYDGERPKLGSRLLPY